MSYFESLVEIRRKFYGENDAPGLEKVVESSQPKQGIFQRPTETKRGTPKVQLTESNLGSTQSFRDFMAQMKNYEEQARASIASDPAESFQPTRSYKPKVEEKLGVKQDPVGQLKLERSGDNLTSTPSDAVKEITRISETAKALMPAEVLGDEQFMRRIEQVSNRFKIKPNDLLAVIHFETGGTFSPSIKNPGSSATGIIQFVEDTAKGLGTSTAELAKMTRAQQMDYVERYLAQWESRIKGASVEDLYMAVLNPSAIRKDPEHTLFQQGTVQYEKNRGLDKNGDGRITKAEASSSVVQRSRGLMSRPT